MPPVPDYPSVNAFSDAWKAGELFTVFPIEVSGGPADLLAAVCGVLTSLTSPGNPPFVMGPRWWIAFYQPAGLEVGYHALTKYTQFPSFIYAPDPTLTTMRDFENVDAYAATPKATGLVAAGSGIQGRLSNAWNAAVSAFLARYGNRPGAACGMNDAGSLVAFQAIPFVDATFNDFQVVLVGACVSSDLYTEAPPPVLTLRGAGSPEVNGRWLLNGNGFSGGYANTSPRWVMEGHEDDANNFQLVYNEGAPQWELTYGGALYYTGIAVAPEPAPVWPWQAFWDVSAGAYDVPVCVVGLPQMSSVNAHSRVPRIQEAQIVDDTGTTAQEAFSNALNTLQASRPNAIVWAQLIVWDASATSFQCVLVYFDFADQTFPTA